MTIRKSESIPVAQAGVINRKIKSSPAARRLARELGIDLEKIQGTGPGGRITAEDVQSATPAVAASVIVKATPLVKNASSS